jgi:uncharacterized membrane protein (DUF485 family)
MSVTQSAGRRVSAYEVVHASREFQGLRRHFSAFVTPAVVSFIVWYMLFAILSAFAPGFMAISVAGAVNVGLIFGVLQFVSTFAIAVLFLRWGRNKFDAQSTRLRMRLEQGRGGQGGGR